MILSQGLGHFYDLRKGIGKPAGKLAPLDFDWLQTLAQQAEADALATAPAPAHTDVPAPAHTTANTTTLTAAPASAEPSPAATGAKNGEPPKDSAAEAVLALPISGIHCTGCRWLIHQLFTQQPGHGTCELDGDGLFIRFSWKVPATNTEESFTPRIFANTLHSFGYTLENPALPRTEKTGKTSSTANVSPRKRLAPRLLLCGVFALNAIVFSLPMRLGANAEAFPLLRLFGLVVLLCATLSIGLAVSYFWKKTTFFLPKDTTGDIAGNARSGGVEGSYSTHCARFSLRRLLAVALFALWLASLAGQSVGLPAVFAPDAVAAIGFVALLIAFVAKR